MTDQHLNIQDLQRLRRLAAFMILEYGPEFAYVLDRVEALLEKAEKSDPTARAIRILNDLKPIDHPETAALRSPPP